MYDFEICGSTCVVMFDLVIKICADNNLAKSQIFKGDGWFHLHNIVKREFSPVFSLLNKLTKELNIGAYIAKFLLNDIVAYYENVVESVLEIFDEITLDPGGPGVTGHGEGSGDGLMGLGDSIPESVETRINRDRASIISSILNLILMNRFIDNLFKRTFINERERLRNMFLLQQAIFRPVAEIFLPNAIAILENDTLRRTDPNHFIPSDLLKFGNEDALIMYVNKTDLNNSELNQLKLHCCTSSVRVINKVTKSVFSRKVMVSMQRGLVEVEAHLLRVDWSNNYPHTPSGKDAEFIKLLRFFVVVPEANWLIDRVADFQRTVVTDDDHSQDLINALLSKASQFKLERFEDGQTYIMGGIFPMIYKYVTAFYNLVNYKEKDDILKGLQRIQSLIDNL
jgi:hypothetical protein